MIKHTSLGASIGVSMKSVVPRARAEVMMAGITCSGSGAKILNSSVLLPSSTREVAAFWAFENCFVFINIIAFLNLLGVFFTIEQSR